MVCGGVGVVGGDIRDMKLQQDLAKALTQGASVKNLKAENAQEVGLLLVILA